MSDPNWPMGDSYQRMLQNPSSAFLSGQLQQCEIKKDSRGLPRVSAGAFAVVFKATLPAGNHQAVRAFISHRPEVNKRYQAISTHLKKHGEISSIVNFEYHNEGIRVPNQKGQLSGSKAKHSSNGPKTLAQTRTKKHFQTQGLAGEI